MDKCGHSIPFHNNVIILLSINFFIFQVISVVGPIFLKHDKNGREINGNIFHIVEAGFEAIYEYYIGFLTER